MICILNLLVISESSKVLRLTNDIMETVVLNLAIQMKLPNKLLVYSACSPGLGNGPRNHMPWDQFSTDRERRHLQSCNDQWPGCFVERWLEQGRPWLGGECWEAGTPSPGVCVALWHRRPYEAVA